MDTRYGSTRLQLQDGRMPMPLVEAWSYDSWNYCVIRGKKEGRITLREVGPGWQARIFLIDLEKETAVVSEHVLPPLSLPEHALQAAMFCVNGLV